MNSNVPSSSSQQRREIMQRVEDMVASIEARVRAKQEEGQQIHRSSNTSSDDTLLQSNMANNFIINSFGVSSSTGEAAYEEICSDEDEEEYDRNRDLESSIHVSDVSTSDDEEQEEFYQQKQKVLDASQVYSSGSDESLESLFGSPDEIPAEYRTSGDTRLTTPIASNQQQTTTRSLRDDMDMERHVDLHPEKSTFDSFKDNALPQDRSVGSKVSGTSNESKSSKISNATPYQAYNSDPIISPHFSLISPAIGRAGIHSKIPKTDTKAYYRGGSILSPPKVKTVHKSKSASKAGTNASGKSTLQDMKKEIDDLTKTFSKLQNQSRQRRARFDLDPEDRFDDSLDTMGRKADAMADALHRNYARSDQLQRENNVLSEQVRNLKGGSCSELKTERKVKVYKSPSTLLKELDSSDDYVKRSYPPVPKTPGTMFTTEIVEVLALEIGEHAYLAEIMDRQWNTSTDFRP